MMQTNKTRVQSQLQLINQHLNHQLNWHYVDYYQGIGRFDTINQHMIYPDPNEDNREK